MSMRVVEFVENWASENIAADCQQAAPALASQCIAAASAAGIPKSEIEDTFDDLSAFMAGEIEEAKDRIADPAEDDDEDIEDREP
jgi:hypothetical protein